MNSLLGSGKLHYIISYNSVYMYFVNIFNSMSFFQLNITITVAFSYQAQIGTQNTKTTFMEQGTIK